MNVSGIEWLQNPDGSKGLTVNPVIGCTRISPGCGGGYIKGPNGEQGGCWAEELVATRMSRNPLLPMYKDLADGDKWSGVVKLVPERLREIVALGRRKKGSRVFPCDLSDLFHDKVPFEFIAAFFGAVACAPNHLFYVLTKRADRAVAFAEWISKGSVTERILSGMADYQVVDDERTECDIANYINGWSRWANMPDDGNPLDGTQPRWPLSNVAFGVTVEDRRYGVPRLDLARRFPARWHWASVEPQLEDLGDVDFAGFDLIINGGEAGPDSRPFDLQWARNVRDAARASGALYFMKQAGDNVIDSSRVDIIDPSGKAKYVRDAGVEVELAYGYATSPHRVMCGKKGSDLDRLPGDLRIRENLPLPRTL